MELMKFPSRGGLSVRSIFTFVLAVLFTALLWTTLSSTVTHAADARWGGDSIIYDNHGFTASTDTVPSPVPSDAKVYKSPIQTVGTERKVFVIYFSAGVDPPTATEAKYVEFDYDDGELSNPSNQKTIAMTLQSEADNTSSCVLEGVGWLICPVSNFLADAMDSVFNILSEMIKVQPLMVNDTGNGMYVAWNVMRSVANLAFVIAFLIIIFSQLTNVGVSNYGLKKLIPRLIVAAVLVNVSFYVSAIAIDASNILGYSVQDVFNGIRESIFHLTADELGTTSSGVWAGVTTAVLSGAGLVGGVYYLATGGIFLLLPLLVGLLLTLILVVVILAARQAIIILLVIIAPLAFVANLLPNTEKWFGKWRDLFMTMLIFFPAFSLVFGGSQLAGQVIIQNANGNIITLIFGLAVQIAPLVITPLLLKFSGGLLGRIAQIANNPRKGLIDRSRNWGQSRAELARKRNLSVERKKYNPMRAGAAMSRRMDKNNRLVKDKTAMWEQAATNAYEDSDKYKKLHQERAVVDENKAAIHNAHEAHLESLRSTPGNALHDAAMKTRTSEDRLKTSQEGLSRYYNTQRMAEGSAMNLSNNALETAKADNAASEQDKEAYLNRQRTYRATALGAAAERLEAAKANAEGWQSSYTAHIEDLKVKDPTLSGAVKFAQSSKEHAEGAQNRVQAMFDVERRVTGTQLNASTLDLEGSKSVAEKAKNEAASYIAAQRTDDNGILRVRTVEAEKAKLTQQIADARLTKMVEEFKTGKINPETLSPAELVVMEQMKSDAITLSAEKQAASSAQFEIQRNIADVMTGSGPLTDQMLDVAQGVGGPAARFRAQSQAVKAARSLESDALGANVELLKDAAQKSGTNIKRYSQGLLEAVIGGQSMFDDQFITPEKVKAALQAQADEKNIPIFEVIKGSRHFDQQMVNEIVALNNGAFKAGGAFGLQDDPTLNIDNFDTEEEYTHALRVQRMSNLANANASGLASWKFGMFVKLAKPEELHETILATLQDANDPSKSDFDRQMARESLAGAYKTVRDALSNDDIRATMNDREKFVRTIEAELAKIHGQEPLPAEPLEAKIDPKTYAAQFKKSDDSNDQ